MSKLFFIRLQRKLQRNNFLFSKQTSLGKHGTGEHFFVSLVFEKCCECLIRLLESNFEYKEAIVKLKVAISIYKIEVPNASSAAFE